VQNAVGCYGQYSDIAGTSPEGINLDVIGYDLANDPMVTTNAATNMASSSGTLNGTVDPNGVTTGVHFEYGTTTNYGITSSSHNYSGNTTHNASANIAGLIPNTTYHFRIVGTSNAGTSYGGDRIFTTLGPIGPPIAKTNPATNVASFSATVNGSVYPHGLTTTMYFQHGTTTSYGSTTSLQTKMGETYHNVSADISGLNASTTYHFRMVATNSAGTRYGGDGTFTTPSATGPPIVTTDAATNIANSSAILHGSVDPHGLTTTVHFQYGMTTSYGHDTGMQSRRGNTYRNIAANISGLTTHTTYHFRIVATNSAGIRFGSDRTFTTP
jgi:phosphodiesterase/alkaline phosphatase D-like protein